MDVSYTTNKITGRVSKVTLVPSGAADELFLGDLVRSFRDGNDIEVVGLDGSVRVFTPGSNDEQPDNGEEQS